MPVKAESWTQPNDQLASFTGILTMLTLQRKYTASARYICTNPACLEEYTYTYSVRPVASSQLFSDCMQCGCDMREDISAREVCDLRYGYLVPIEALESDFVHTLGSPACRYQAVRVCFRDMLCSDLHLGGRYCVVGLMNLLLDSVCLQAVSVTPILYSTYIMPTPFAFSRVIETLYHDRSFSPWSFVLSLAYIFAAPFSPPGTYFRLKLAILLSAVSCGALRYNRHLHLLALGHNQTALRDLMWLGSQLTRRRVQHSAQSCHLVGTVSSSEDTHEIHAGSLVLARGGVALLGDLSLYDSISLRLLHKCLENHTVDVTLPERRGIHTDHLLCQVWATYRTHASVSTGSVFDSVGSTLRGSCVTDKSNTLSVLSDLFGIVFMTDAQPEYDLANDLFTSQILHAAQGNTVPPSMISFEELRSFVTSVSDRCLQMDEEAEDLIRRYFVASRRVRNSPNAPNVPMAALSTISSIAHSFSQLALMQSVTYDSVLMAILLYEEYLVACYKFSPLSVQYTPHVKEADLDTNLGRFNDSLMQKFKVDLEEFISNWI